MGNGQWPSIIWRVHQTLEFRACSCVSTNACTSRHKWFKTSSSWTHDRIRRSSSLTIWFSLVIMSGVHFCSAWALVETDFWTCLKKNCILHEIILLQPWMLPHQSQQVRPEPGNRESHGQTPEIKQSIMFIANAKAKQCMHHHHHQKPSANLCKSSEQQYRVAFTVMSLLERDEGAEYPLPQNPSPPNQPSQGRFATTMGQHKIAQKYPRTKICQQHSHILHIQHSPITSIWICDRAPWRPQTISLPDHFQKMVRAFVQRSAKAPQPCTALFFV